MDTSQHACLIAWKAILLLWFADYGSIGSVIPLPSGREQPEVLLLSEEARSCAQMFAC